MAVTESKNRARPEAPKASFGERVCDYWLAEPAIGKRSRLGAIFYGLTLGPVWRFIGKRISSRVNDNPLAWSTSMSSSRSSTSWKQLLNPVYWLVWSVRFVYELIVTRPYTKLGPAIPAVVVGLAFAFLGYHVFYQRSAWREDYYRGVLKVATQSDDKQLMRLALSNLVAKHPERVDLRLQQALLDDKLGAEAAAYDSMVTLAEVNKNATAAFWLIRKSYGLHDLAKWPEEKHQKFRSLMQIIVTDSKATATNSLVAARVLMAQYLVGIGAHTEAIANLESVAGETKDLQLFTASLHAQLGNQAQAEQWAERAAKFYQDQLLVKPEDTTARLNLARAMLILKRDEEIARTLSDGYKLTRDPQLLIAGGESLANWANSIQEKEPLTDQSLIRRLQLLRRAAELAPNNALVIESLMTIVIQCAESENSQIASLRTSLLSSVDADKLHFVQGTVALLQGRIEDAYKHLELAALNMDNMPGVLNNLAVVLSERANPDLEKAYALSNAALKSAPNHPYLRETRGQILLRMGDYDQAILDLEFALAAPELAPAIHASLAKAYDAIGLPELAEKHLELSRRGS